MKKYMLLLSAICFLFSCVKKEQPVESPVETRKSDSSGRYISARGGLNLRDKPDISGKKVTAIPDGERVEFIEETGKEVQIGNAVGKWSRIKWREYTGWAFGGFLEKTQEGQSGQNGRITGLSGTYRYAGKVEHGQMRNRVTINDFVITRAPGGNALSSEFCIIESVAVEKNSYTVRCSADKNLSPEDLKKYEIDMNATRLKKIIVVDMNSGNIEVDNQPYSSKAGAF